MAESVIKWAIFHSYVKLSAGIKEFPIIPYMDEGFICVPRLLTPWVSPRGKNQIPGKTQSSGTVGDSEHTHQLEMLFRTKKTDFSQNRLKDTVQDAPSLCENRAQRSGLEGVNTQHFLTTLKYHMSL